MALAAVVVVLSLGGGSQAFAGTVDLQAPDPVSYSEPTNVVTWQDNSTGEDGYRIDVTFGATPRSFQVGPDTEQLQIPDDFRPGCPTPGPNVEIVVTALSGSTDGPPGTFVMFGLCPPSVATATPSATIAGGATVVATDVSTPMATAAPELTLPETGSGAQVGAPDAYVAAFPLFVFATASMALVILRRLRR
ncbi:MAG: hypothetical protein WEE64_12875 [Dehalococcoidia bacterium]